MNPPVGRHRGSDTRIHPPFGCRLADSPCRSPVTKDCRGGHGYRRRGSGAWDVTCSIASMRLCEGAKSDSRGRGFAHRFSPAASVVPVHVAWPAPRWTLMATIQRPSPLQTARLADSDQPLCHWVRDVTDNVDVWRVAGTARSVAFPARRSVSGVACVIAAADDPALRAQREVNRSSIWCPCGAVGRGYVADRRKHQGRDRLRALGFDAWIGPVAFKASKATVSTLSPLLWPGVGHVPMGLLQETTGCGAGASRHRRARWRRGRLARPTCGARSEQLATCSGVGPDQRSRCSRRGPTRLDGRRGCRAHIRRRAVAGRVASASRSGHVWQRRGA